MNFIDTHAHLYADEFNDDRSLMIERAISVGVNHIFLPNIDVDSIEKMHELELSNPTFFHSMMGLHPCSVTENFQSDLALMKAWFNKRNFYAVGEIGIDLFWDKSTYEIQRKAFLIQCEWAIEMGIPIVIHCRNAFSEIIETLKEFKQKHSVLPRGIFHCFSGSKQIAEQLIDEGFLLGIGGVLTYNNSKLAEVLTDIDLKYLVLETDAPYLPPVPYRGKRNETAYIIEVAKRLAIAKNTTLEHVAEQTSNNALSLFKINL